MCFFFCSPFLACSISDPSNSAIPLALGLMRSHGTTIKEAGGANARGRRVGRQEGGQAEVGMWPCGPSYMIHIVETDEAICQTSYVQR